MNYYQMRNVPINQINAYNKIQQNRRRYSNWENENSDEYNELMNTLSNKNPTAGTIGSYSSITNRFNNVYRNPLYNKQNGRKKNRNYS